MYLRFRLSVVVTLSMRFFALVEAYLSPQFLDDLSVLGDVVIYTHNASGQLKTQSKQLDDPFSVAPECFCLVQP